MSYKEIIEHYEKCFDKFGFSLKGVDWTKEDQANIRYQVMIDSIYFHEKSFNFSEKRSVLDFGCGLSHLYDYILKKKLKFIDYTGLEISEKFFNASKKKYPKNKYILGDILKEPSILKNNYDYIILNGVFTEKRNLTFDYFFEYLKKMILIIFTKSNKAIAFNVMSKHVDWEKDFLFHLSIDDMANFITKKISRNFIIRNDYNLYEYSVYIYK